MSDASETHYPYADHDQGIVLTQPRCGEFERRPMTTAELLARDPALAIAKDIYRHANYAGVCYYEFWGLISKAIQAGIEAELAAETRRRESAESLLKNLLARIFRDGGQKQDRFATLELACNCADDTVVGLISQAESAEARVAKMTKERDGWQADFYTAKASWNAACNDIGEAEARLREANRWIPVGENVPEPDKWVLVHHSKWTGVGRYRPMNKCVEESERWQDERSEFIEHNGPMVTHWRPLPAPPEGNGG